MLSKSDKKRIVERLNYLFDTYDEMSAVCKGLKNDEDEIKKTISKIIKYAFVSRDFIREKQSLLASLYFLPNVDDRYSEFLNTRKNGFFSRFRNKNKDITKREKIKSKCGYTLDDDIDLDDIEGLRIPSIGYIQRICEENVSQEKYESKKKSEKEEFYRRERHFPEIAFRYTRPELLTIDSSFVYYNLELSGDLYEDYRFLYSGERYREQGNLNPLNRSFEENLAEIKKKNDIRLRKYGNVHVIENGRHRLIYLLREAESNLITIPVSMTRRIENQEFNQILNQLKSKYDIKIYKNNLLNDEPNILIELNGFAYVIKDMDELKRFTDTLNKEQELDKFIKIPFEVNKSLNKKETIEDYKLMIFERYEQIGESAVLGNYSDTLKDYGDVDSRYFYMAYNSMQSEYQESLIYNYKFESSVRDVILKRKSLSQPSTDDVNR